MTTSETQQQCRVQINQRHAIVDRLTWGIRPPRICNLVADWDHTGIALHHSGNWGMKEPAEIETHHMVKNAWDDVGYHYLIKSSGAIYEGRKIYNKGSHLGGANTGRIGILLLGDFDEQWYDFDDTLSKSHISATNSLIKTLRCIFPIRYLGGHKEYLPGKDYTCPGNLIMDKLDLMRKKHGLSKP